MNPKFGHFFLFPAMTMIQKQMAAHDFGKICKDFVNSDFMLLAVLEQFINSTGGKI